MLERNKHIATILFIPLLLYFKEFFSILVFGSIPLVREDNLDSVAVYSKIISQFYTEGFKAVNIFLSGHLKWYNLDRVFNPLVLVYTIFNFKTAYFFEVLLFKFLAFFSFFKLGKKIHLKFEYLITCSIIYSLLATSFYSFSILILFYPYVLYLILKNKKIKPLNYLILIFIGSNSSLVFDLFSLLLFIIFLYQLDKKILKNKSTTKIFIILFITIFLFNFYILLNFIGQTIHRTEFVISTSLTEILKDTIKNFFFLSYDSKDLIFYFPYCIITIFILINFFLQNDYKFKKIIIIYILYFILLIILIKFFKIFLFDLGIVKTLTSIQFERIGRLKPFIIIFLLAYFFIIEKKFLIKKYVNYFLIFSIFLIQLNLIFLNFFRVFIFSNYNDEDLSYSKKLYHAGEYKKLIFMINKINLKKIDLNFTKYNQSFDNFYKFPEYFQIKKIVKDDLTISIKLDPMIAVANNIRVADGYHQIYPLDYKHEFKKIILDEIDKNKKVEKYFNEWGSRLYIFISDEMKIQININQLKKLNIKYIILPKNINLRSQYPNELALVCCLNNNVKLLKIIY